MIKYSFKKIFIIFLFSLVFINLVSCNNGTKHEHTYSSIWSSDEQYHWHSATCSHTDMVSDKQVHIWDEGKIIKEVTDESDGTILYTCLTCGKEVVVDVPKGSSLNEGEWDFIK